MRILVFDDNPVHRAAAISQLSGHEVVVVETYDQAEEMLKKEVWSGEPNPKCQQFDVVMTDLMVPPSDQNLSNMAKEVHMGKGMPLGTFIAIRAMSVGVKKVAIVTDANHHEHPASAALDDLEGFAAGDIKLYCTNTAVRKENGVTVKQWWFVLERLLED